MTFSLLRLRLAKWIAGEHYLVLGDDDLDELLNVRSEAALHYALHLIGQADRVVPQLFASTKTEIRH